MTKGTFKKVGKSNKKMYGPRKLLVCGYLPGEQTALLRLLGKKGFKDLAVVFAADDGAAQTIGELLAADDRAGLGQPGEMRRAIIMSGVTPKELHRLMKIYRLCELPSPLWASLTPISETWTLSRLLDELTAESEAMKRHKKGAARYVHKDAAAPDRKDAP